MSKIFEVKFGKRFPRMTSPRQNTVQGAVKGNGTIFLYIGY